MCTAQLARVCKPGYVHFLKGPPELSSILTLGDRSQFRTLFPSAPRVYSPNVHLGICPTDPSFQKCSRFLHPWLSRTFWGSQTQQVHCSRNLLWSDSWPHAQHQRAQLPRGSRSPKEAAFQPGGLDKPEPASHCSLPRGSEDTSWGKLSREAPHRCAAEGQAWLGPRAPDLGLGRRPGPQCEAGGGGGGGADSSTSQRHRGKQVTPESSCSPQRLRPTPSGQENLGFLTQHQALGGKPRPPEACLR